MVLSGASTGTVNVQVLECKSMASCVSGFNQFFSKSTVSKIILTDAEGGLLKSLNEGEIDLMDMQGRLSRERNIHFEVATPQAHYQHGEIEKKIHLLQESLKRSELRNSATTATAWMTVGKYIKHYVNSIPIDYLYHSTGGKNPPLQILSPNSLKLITAGDRAPVSLFYVPQGVDEMLETIEQKYTTWYEVFNMSYLPIIMQRQKWYFSKENLVEGDIFYFKLTESKMLSSWKVGKVENVTIGKDGFVRHSVILYNDVSGDYPEDWAHWSVERPVRNIIKLFNIKETSLISNL